MALHNFTSAKNLTWLHFFMISPVCTFISKRVVHTAPHLALFLHLLSFQESIFPDDLLEENSHTNLHSTVALLLTSP